jgi:diguanylate cyclase (GGDEF)-like protein
MIAGLMIAYALLGQLSVKLPSGATISAAYPLVAAAVVALGTGPGMIAILPGWVIRLVKRGDPPLRILFNVGQIAVSCYVGGAVFALSGGHPGVLLPPIGFGQFLLMSIAFDAANIALVQGRLALQEGGSWATRWWRSFATERGFVTPIYHVLGLTTTLLYIGYGDWGLVAACMPLLGLHVFFRVQVQAAESRRHAATDQLTGLANYRGLQEWLRVRTQPVEDLPLRLTMFWLDVDDLKLINDRFGHDAGNAALRAVADVLRASTRTGDIVARYGGDEFVVVVDDVSSADARSVGTRIAAALETTSIICNGERVGISVSLGSASLPQDAATVDDLLAASDVAMYQRKLQRRARLGTTANAVRTGTL